MKKVIAAAVSVIIFSVGFFAGYSINLSGYQGIVKNVQILDYEPSEIYSNDDIDSAFETVKTYFKKEFEGCTLTKLYYPGDGSNYTAECKKWAEFFNADDAIVLLSSFDVDESDEGFNPNSTYDNWKWILVRNKGGKWTHADHGY